MNTDLLKIESKFGFKGLLDHSTVAALIHFKVSDRNLIHIHSFIAKLIHPRLDSSPANAQSQKIWFIRSALECSTDRMFN